MVLGGQGPQVTVQLIGYWASSLQFQETEPFTLREITGLLAPPTHEAPQEGDVQAAVERGFDPFPAGGEGMDHSIPAVAMEFGAQPEPEAVVEIREFFREEVPGSDTLKIPFQPDTGGSVVHAHPPFEDEAPGVALLNVFPPVIGAETGMVRDDPRKLIGEGSCWGLLGLQTEGGALGLLGEVNDHASGSQGQAGP